MNIRGVDKIVEIKCKNCGKGMYIYDKYVREQMFCTLGCLEVYNKEARLSN